MGTYVIIDCINKSLIPYCGVNVLRRLIESFVFEKYSKTPPLKKAPKLSTKNKNNTKNKIK